MAETVGDIALQLGINQNDFNRQLQNVQNTAQNTGNVLSNALTGNGNIANIFNRTAENPLKNSFNAIGNSASKLGGIISGIFALGSIKNFVSECLELGSDLAEVQNVVDVTFTSMSDSVNEFSKNAMNQFGLSETVAKNYMGTFGAMSKAFGFTEEQSYDMAKAITGLTADVSSFYNLSTDEAYTKMKSIWTGETESLKDLGVVMTQTALDNYALANGYGKTTSKMTEQEKVALRYQFVLEQLSLAQGDFSRTSDGWANQTRVLSLKFDSLKSTLGQGFINVFTPIVQGINIVLSKLQILADKFKEFTENIFGNSGNGNTSSTDALAGSLSNATDNSDALGDSAVKTSKKMKSLMGFDEINRLSDNSNDDDTTSNIDIPTVDDGLNNTNQGLDITNGKLAEILNFLKKIKDIAKNIADLFLKGFEIGFGDTNFNNIKKSLQGIKGSLKDIFTNKDVQNSVTTLAESIVLNLGKVIGSIASIGETYAELLTGSMEKYLEQNKPRIVTAIITMLDIKTDINNLIGDLFVSIADIFTVFRSNDAKQIGADFINIFSTAFYNIKLLSSIATKNVISAFVVPITKNTDKIKSTFSGLLSVLKTTVGTVSSIFSTIGDSFQKVYKEKLSPAFDTIHNAFSDIFGTALDTINTNVIPVLQSLGDKFNSVANDYIKPALEDIINTFRNIVNDISILIDTTIKPIIQWVIEKVVPPVSNAFKIIGQIASNICGFISTVVKNAIGIIGDVISVIVGIVTGDGEKVKTSFEDILDRVKNTFDTFKTTIKNIITEIWQNIKEIFNLDTVKSHFESIVDNISTTFSSIKDRIKESFQNAWDNAKNVFEDKTSFFDGVMEGITNSIKSGLNNSIDFINNAINGLNNIKIDVLDRLSEKTGIGDLSLNIPNIPQLANGGIVSQPTLAMVGEYSGATSNPEVIAPLDRLTDLISSKNDNSDIISALERIADLLANMKTQVNVNIPSDYVSTEIDNYNVRTGGRK